MSYRALVIGNGRYSCPDIPVNRYLTCAPNAYKIRLVLESIGYQTTLGLNLSGSEMKALITSFLTGNASQIIIYYTGYAFTSSSTGIMLFPVDYASDRDNEIRLDFFLETGNRKCIFILDIDTISDTDAICNSSLLKQATIIYPIRFRTIEDMLDDMRVDDKIYRQIDFSAIQTIDPDLARRIRIEKIKYRRFEPLIRPGVLTDGLLDNLRLHNSWIPVLDSVNLELTQRYDRHFQLKYRGVLEIQDLDLFDATPTTCNT